VRYFYALLAVSGWVWLTMVFGYLILRIRAERKSAQEKRED
jgi:phage shock protein PspC (stress-responsive transcriptional regulator)